MSFWRKLSKFIFGEIPSIEDDFFGIMLECGSYYECQKLFRPTEKVIVLHVDNVNGGVSDRQKEFFLNLEENYDQLVSDISPAIEKRVSEWIKGFKIKDFKSEFTLEFITIPKLENDAIKWNIAFYANNDLQHSCSIDMEDGKVTHIQIDG
ncbi:MAG: hypothetical protein AAGJ18_08370 [Bacteroidota bacterium]